MINITISKKDINVLCDKILNNDKFLNNAVGTTIKLNDTNNIFIPKESLISIQNIIYRYKDMNVEIKQLVIDEDDIKVSGDII